MVEGILRIDIILRIGSITGTFHHKVFKENRYLVTLIVLGEIPLILDTGHLTFFVVDTDNPNLTVVRHFLTIAQTDGVTIRFNENGITLFVGAFSKEGSFEIGLVADGHVICHHGEYSQEAAQSCH